MNEIDEKERIYSYLHSHSGKSHEARNAVQILIHKVKNKDWDRSALLKMIEPRFIFINESNMSAFIGQCDLAYDCLPFVDEREDADQIADWILNALQNLFENKKFNVWMHYLTKSSSDTARKVLTKYFIDYKSITKETFTHLKIDDQCAKRIKEIVENKVEV